MTRNDEIGRNKIPVGATRPAVVSFLNITYIWLIPVVAVPMVLILITRNVFWGVLALPMLHLARRSNADPGLPRIWWLWAVSGSMFANRSERGVEVVSAARDADAGDGVRHG